LAGGRLRIVDAVAGMGNIGVDDIVTDRPREPFILGRLTSGHARP
jgi:hypothetical protein